MAEVCLILEGTYPYAAGGVSTCVHQLISLLPNVSFTLVYIGASRNELRRLRFRLPPNVVGLHEIFLYDAQPAARRRRRLGRADLGKVSALHDELHLARAEWHGDAFDVERVRQVLGGVAAEFTGTSRLIDSMSSRSIWRMMREDYGRLDWEISFINFYFSWQSAHLPLYRLLSAWMPKADVYHALCAGFAGFLGATAAIRNNAGFVLTEHGLYAHERAIELTDAHWLDDGSRLHGPVARARLLSRWWVDFFYNLSRLSYLAADRVVSLYDGYRRAQQSDGAKPERTEVIPNGLGNEFFGLRRRRPGYAGGDAPFRLGFVGRVVQIKDIKTLIKACFIAKSRRPGLSCLIAGPCDDETGYVEECVTLVKLLGLESAVMFAGPRDARDVYGAIDCLVISSISEAQPMVILEANSAGVPVVSTDVGACREMLEGRGPVDRALGPSGLVVPMGDAEAMAKALLTIAEDADLWERLSVAGTRRVSEYYNIASVTQRYGYIYQDFVAGLVELRADLGGQKWPASASA